MDLVAAVGGREWLFSLADADSQVVVDFSHPDVVMEHIRFCLDQNIHVIAGTSGFTDERLETIEQWRRREARTRRHGGPELRHRRRADAPGSPARRPGSSSPSRSSNCTTRARPTPRPGPLSRPHERWPWPATRPGSAAVPDATTLETDGARGATVDGIRVHSVRLPGLVAHQEVILGSAGETLTIRHDSLHRSSFMPGVLTAIRAVSERPGLTHGPGAAARAGMTRSQ